MDKKVGVGIIGTGFARRVQISAFRACKDAEIVSVASGSIKNAKATADEYGIGHFTDQWRDTVSRDDVDLVCITTPPNLHREMALFALGHGKHVLCEKPMAMNVAETEEMVAAAKDVDVLALIDHELRFLPGRQKAFAMLRDGAIGKIGHAKYNFRAGYRADTSLPWNWWSDIEQGGGALGAINSHIIDSFRWLLGTEVSSVSCQLRTHVKERSFDGAKRKVTSDDEANMILRFADSELTGGATGLVSVGMAELPEYQNRVELFGSEGAMRIDGNGELFLAKNGESSWMQIETDIGKLVDGMPDSGFSRGSMFLAPKIVDAIAAGRTEIENAATFEDGHQVQKVLDAARESDAEGRVVNLS
jgi:predicted dehydrogenase